MTFELRPEQSWYTKRTANVKAQKSKFNMPKVSHVNRATTWIGMR